MNKKHDTDEWIDRALRDEQTLPEGLSDRLESFLDRLAEAEERTQKRIFVRRRVVWAFSGAVAALLLVSLLLLRPQTAPGPLSDTFTDPDQAVLATEQALGFLSLKFNKGIDQLSEAAREIEKANEILIKHLPNHESK